MTAARVSTASILEEPFSLIQRTIALNMYSPSDQSIAIGLVQRARRSTQGTINGSDTYEVLASISQRQGHDSDKRRWKEGNSSSDSVGGDGKWYILEGCGGYDNESEQAGQTEEDVGQPVESNHQQL